MATVAVREELEAAADRVWEQIQDFGSTRAWLPAARVLDILGTGAGAMRRVQIDENVFEERCESHDSVARRLSYALLTETPGLRNYVAVVEVEPLAGERAAITWSCSFDCAPGAEGELRQRYERLYRDSFIASLRSYLARTTACR